MRCVFWGSSLGGLENLQTAMRVCGANVVVLSSRLRGTVRLPAPSGRHGSTVAAGAGADDVLRGLREQGGRVDSRTYVKLLQRCMELRDVALGKRVRDHIVRSGRQLNVYELNTLVKLYSLCGSVDDARRVFDGVVDKTVVSWNAMIAGYARLGRVKDAFTLFRQMLDEGLEPNTITYLTVLDACSSPAALEWGKGVHARALDAGFVSDFRVGTALVNMYVKGGRMEDARRVFDGLVKRDVSAFNAMIGGYARNGDGDQAFEVFRLMQREGTKPNRISYLSILDACSGPDGLAWGKAVHAQCVKAGLADDIRVATALLRMYTKCGSIEDARNVFDNMAVRDVVSWTVMIEGYAESGHIEDAFGVFAMMREGGIQPDKVTYMHVLNACASSADLKSGREVHSEVERAGFGSDLLVSTALIHMYAKCGAVKDARRVFDGMSERDVVSWSAMIGGYAEAGCGEEAFEIFHQMKLQGVEPERVTYINILNVCVNPGVLDLGKELMFFCLFQNTISQVFISLAV